MKNTLVIYKSIYGSTKKYAEWIRDELKADFIGIDDVNPDDLYEYDNIIIGVPVFAAKSIRMSIIKKLLLKREDTRIFVFFVSLGQISHQDLYLDLSRRLRKDMRHRLKSYVFPGEINYVKLSLKHKAALGIVFRHLKRIVPSKRDEETQKFIEFYGKHVDFTDKKAIWNLIADCRTQKT